MTGKLLSGTPLLATRAAPAGYTEYRELEQIATEKPHTAIGAIIAADSHTDPRIA